MPRDGQPPLLSFIFTLFRSSELGRKYGGRREAGVCGRATDVSTDRAGWGDGRDGMRWEINKTVTYLPLPGAGLHALSAVSSVFLSPLSFRADCVFTSRPHLSLSSTAVPKSVRGIRSSWNEALNISIWHHSRLRESVDVTWWFASARTHTRAFLPGYALSSLFSRLSYPTFCSILSIRQKRRGSKARTRAQRERKSGDGKREKQEETEEERRRRRERWAMARRGVPVIQRGAGR